MVDSFKSVWEGIRRLSDQEKVLWWSTNIWAKAAKRLGIVIDKLPVIGGVLSAGGFIVFFSRDSYAGDGPFAKGVGGVGGVALNGALFAGREMTWADLWEDIAKSTGEAIAPITGIADSPMTRSGRSGVESAELLETGLIRQEHVPKLAAKPKPPGTRWGRGLNLLDAE